jgi:hypothetical protein
MLVVTTQVGCRLHAIPPASAARLHDDHWTIERTAVLPPPADDGVPPAPVVPLRERPEVVTALGTARDAFGVPMGLYALDPLLTAHRHEVDVRSENGRDSATAFFIAGGIYAALAATFFGLTPYAYHHAGSREAAAGFLLFSGGLMGIYAAANFGIAASLRGEVDARALERYYRETYER